MTRGLEGYYKLIQIQNDFVLYSYSGDNFNYPYDKKIACQCDGQIKIKLPISDKNTTLEILKECTYAEKNCDGNDILALRTGAKIIYTYKQSGEFPKEGHWIV